MHSSQSIIMVAEGIDTVSTIFINGQQVGTTDNMFVKYTFDVKSFIKVCNSPDLVPAGSPSCGGGVVVYFSDINQLSLPTPFYSVVVSVSVFMALSTVFYSINSPNNSLLSHFVVLVLFLPYLVLSTTYLFMKVSFRPDMILCG